MALKTKELRHLADKFLNDALKSSHNSPSGVSFERLKLTDGFVFNISDEVINSQQLLTDGLIKKLGPVRGHRTDIERTIWNSVTKVLQSHSKLPSPQDVDDLLDEIEFSTALPVRILKPCNNIRLIENRQSINIGPVSIKRSASHIPSFRKSCPKSKVNVHVGHEIVANGFDILLPTFIWDVELVAAYATREEEASWKIDVALSLLRLGVKRSDIGFNVPTLGKVEAHPINFSSPNHNRVTIGPSTKYSVGGSTMLATYELGIGAQRALAVSTFKSKSQLVFSPQKNSLAERFAQGLGWLSRGRQSADRPTRLLYFFTAIEALLSDNDKSSPVVQTVSRHAAVILNDTENESRLQISKTIRELYANRSSLVHTGKRGVDDKDSNTIQYIAELLFDHVWDRIPLTMAHADFVQALSRASYGLKLEI